MEKSKFQNGKKPNFEYKIQKHPANIGWSISNMNFIDINYLKLYFRLLYTFTNRCSTAFKVVMHICIFYVQCNGFQVGTNSDKFHKNSLNESL